MPRPIPSSFLDVAAQRLHDVIIPKIGENSLHMYAIANSGIPIAIGTLMLCGQKDRKGDSVSIIYPESMILEGRALSPSETGVIVDNSVHTGETLTRAVEVLPESTRAEIKTLVTLVDYEDEQHATIVDDIQERHAIEVIGLFKLPEVQRIVI